MTLSALPRRLILALLAVSAIVAGGLTTTLATAQSFGRFSATGPPIEVRRSHTATLLADGNVLVVGGKPWACCGDIATLASAELLVTSSGQFTAAGNLRDARSLHTATLLEDGRVLITGGEDAQGVPSDPFSVILTIVRDQAELYDPKTGDFAVTGTMVTARVSHTATRLPDGKVLVAGGRTSAAELFDPTVGVFSPVGNFSTQRTGHTATLLQSGLVLVTGGTNAAGFLLSSAELYDPATSKFQATGTMADGRAGHSATLLPDGRVLVVAGGPEGTDAATSAELYDPVTGTFSATDSLPTAPNSFGALGTWTRGAALLPTGNVLVVGGPHAGARSATFDPIGEIFTTTTDNPVGGERLLFSTTLLSDGRVLIVGGAATSLAGAEIFTSFTPTLMQAPPAGGQTFGLAGTHDIRALVEAQTFTVSMVWSFDNPTQSWRSYIPGSPSVASTLTSLSATDVITLISE